MLEILSIFLQVGRVMEGERLFRFLFHLVWDWHSVFKMAAGSHDHKASPVFLKQYNF